MVGPQILLISREILTFYKVEIKMNLKCESYKKKVANTLVQSLIFTSNH